MATMGAPTEAAVASGMALAGSDLTRRYGEGDSAVERGLQPRSG